MASEQKSVYFNPENPDDAHLLKFAKKARNFSGYIKKLIYQDMVRNQAEANPYDFVLKKSEQKPQPAQQSFQTLSPLEQQRDERHMSLHNVQPMPEVQEQVKAEKSPPSESDDPRLDSLNAFF